MPIYFNKYIFDRFLFENHIELWTKYLSEFVNKPITYVEIGSEDGSSFTWIHDNIATNSQSTLISVDIKTTLNFRYNLSLLNKKINFVNPHQVFNPNTYCRGEYYVLRQPSSYFFVNISQCNWADIVYIDGSHTYVDTLSDGIGALQIVKIGGLIIFDDYKWKCYDQPIITNRERTRIPMFAIQKIINTYPNIEPLVYNTKRESDGKPINQIILRKIK